MVRRLAAPVLAALTAGSCESEPVPPPDANGAMAKACRFLWSKQAADGGWHSEHYGLLRSGQSLTAFALATLLEVPDGVDPVPDRDARIVRAVGFIARHVTGDGALGRFDGDSDYPNYASAWALRALQALRVRAAPEPSERAALRARVRDYLLGQQFREELGWQESDPAFGGWGMGGAPPRGPGDPGHVDLSMTRVVAESLAQCEPRPAAAFRRLSEFLDRCRSADGGFFFSPVVLGANKGDRIGTGFAGYGSATADGILALLAMGASPDDPRVVRARDRLVAAHRLDRVPGIPLASPTRWAQALRFYYMAVSAESLARLGVDEAPKGRDWRADLHRALCDLQRHDGGFANPVGQVKEDDPLIATTLALRAWIAARKQ